MFRYVLLLNAFVPSEMKLQCKVYLKAIRRKELVSGSLIRNLRRKAFSNVNFAIDILWIFNRPGEH